MRPVLAAALLALAVSPAAAQTERTLLAALVVDGGGSTETTRPRVAAQAGYAIEETAGSGLSIGARYVLAAHLLSADAAAYRELEGASVVSGGDGWLMQTGVDAEIGWKLGPLRPYGYTGYHYHRQRVEAVVCACPEGAREIPGERHQGFARSTGYGLVVELGARGALYAERFRGGDRHGLMRLEGIRAGVRFGR